MADKVSSQYLVKGQRRIVLHLTNYSDGTGESAVVKIDVSTLVGPDGTPPTSVCIEKIEYLVQGMDVKLEWDATTKDGIAYLTGSGFFDWTEAGGLHDPKSTGTTGDVVLTTVGHTLNDYYTITIYARLED